MFFPSVAGGASRRLPASQPQTVYNASFTNPQPVHKVWAPGIAYTGTIQVPTGYGNISWQIIQHRTFSVVKSGTGVSVNHTFTFNGNQAVNTYALLVNATKPSRPDLWMLCLAEFTCKKTFLRSDANEIWNLNSTNLVKNGGGTNRPGYKIWVEGTTAGANITNFYFQMFGWVSNDPLNPIQVICADATLNTSNTATQSFKLSGNQNITIDGCSDESVQYGLRMNKIGTTSNTENFYIEANGGDTGLVVCGVKVDNGVYTAGGSCFVVQMFNGPTNNANVYTLNWLTFFNCQALNAGAEGFYFMHTWDADVPPFAKAQHFLGYRLLSDGSRNEGMQIGGCIDGELMLGSWTNCGRGAVDGQRNIFVVRPGCDNLSIFANFGWSNYDITFIEPNVTGKNIEIFSNVFLSKNAAFVQGILFRLAQSSVTGTIYTGIRNNLFGVKTGSIGQFYNAPGSPPTTISQLYLDGNIFDTDTLTNYQAYNGYVTTNTISNNKTFTDTSDAFFFNVANDDYRLATLDSPAFGFTRNSTAVAAGLHPWIDYDKFGFKYVATNIAAGSDSGWGLMTGLTQTRDISSVGSLTPITNVPNGTPFGSLALPAKVLVANNDGSTRKLSITWAASTYNGNVAGTYTLDGTLTLPADITNTVSLKAHVDVTVLSPAPVLHLKINVTTGVAAGWIETGAINPVSSGTVDCGQLGSSGVGFRYLNSPSKLWSGNLSSGGSNSTVFPAAVQATFSYVQSPSGANGGDVELYEITPGILSGIYTLQFLAARASIAGPRTTQISTQSGQSGSVNVANNANNLITLTGVTAVNGVIRITMTPIAPNDNGAAYLNGFTLDSQ